MRSCVRVTRTTHCRTPRGLLVRPCGLVAVAGLLALQLEAPALASSLRVVAHSEQILALIDPAAESVRLSPPAITPQGTVAVTAFHRLPGDPQFTGRGTAFVSTPSGGLQRIVGHGEPAPYGGAYDDFSPAVFNDAGQGVFVANASGPGLDETNDRGVFRVESDGSVSTLARAGQSASATGLQSDIVFLDLALPQITSSGQTAFHAYLLDAADPGPLLTGVLKTSPSGALTTVARTYDPAPGTPSPMLLQDFFFTAAPLINHQGRAAFVSALSTPEDPDFATGRGVFRESLSGDLQAVALTGQPAPFDGVPGPTPVFGEFWTLGMNALGEVAITASFEGDFGFNPTAIYSDAFGDGLRLIARPGSEVGPDAPDATIYSIDTPAFNDVGTLSFIGLIQEPGNITQAVLKGSHDGDLAVVAKLWQAAPTGVGGDLFAAFGDVSVNMHIPAMNNRNQTAFYATLTGPSVTQGVNEHAIFAESISGDLELIARTGDEIDVSSVPGVADNRTVSSLFLLGGASTGGGLNYRGEIVYRAEFTDGTSGVFVSSAVVASTLPGDFNGDYVVDANDYAVWRENVYQYTMLPGDTTPGYVDLQDYELWLRNYGAVESLSLAPNPVNLAPEPAGALAALVGMAVLLTRRNPRGASLLARGDSPGAKSRGV